jgi:hypothetical protein
MLRLDGWTPFTTRPLMAISPPEIAFQPRDHVQKRGFPAARGADEDKELAFLDRDVDAVQDFDLPVGFGDVADVEKAHFRPHVVGGPTRGRTGMGPVALPGGRDGVGKGGCGLFRGLVRVEEGGDGVGCSAHDGGVGGVGSGEGRDSGACGVIGARLALVAWAQASIATGRCRCVPGSRPWPG